MSFLRKMYAQIRVGTTDVPADTGEANIVRAGCRVTGTTSGSHILTDNPGGLKPSLYCYAIDTSGDEVPNSKFRINPGSLGQGVTYSTGDSAFKVAFDQTPPTSGPDASWDRIVCDPDYSTSFVDFYQTDTGADTPVSTTITLTTDGKIEGYVKLRDVDIVVDYNSSRTHIVDITTEGREWVTPEDFGAVGDGTTDDAQAFQNALDYLSYVAGGGELRLGAKTYGVTCSGVAAVLSLDIDGSNVHVIGQGSGSVVKQLIEGIDFVGNAITRLFLVAEGANYVSFRDFEIDDSSSATDNGTTDADKACIAAGGSSTQTSGLRIAGLKIRSKNKSGLRIQGCDGFTVINSIIDNNGAQFGGNGIHVLDGTSTTSKRGIIDACQIYDGGSVSGISGIHIQDGNRITISDTSIRGFDYGVDITDAAGSTAPSEISVKNCLIRSQRFHGISSNTTLNANALAFSDNTLVGQVQSGIYLVPVGGDFNRCVIQNNVIRSTGRSGIVLDQLFNGSVTDNNISDWNTDDNADVSAQDRVTRQAGIGLYFACTGTVLSCNNLKSEANTGGGALSYGFVYDSSMSSIYSIGNTFAGTFTSVHYFETPGDAANNSWFNPVHTGTNQYDIAWGDPDETGGLLKKDGGIDTNGGDILLGTGDVDTEGGNVNTGGGAIQEGILADTTTHRASQYIADGSEVATTVASGGSYVKSTSTFTADVTGSNMDNSVNNRIKYTGTADRTFLITYTGSCDAQSSPSPADPASFRFYVYDDSLTVGATVAKSQVNRKVTSAGTGAFAMSMIYTLSTNDYVEIHLTRDTSTHTVTVGPGYFSVVEI